MIKHTPLAGPVACAICRFFVLDAEADRLGECHRRAPVAPVRNDLYPAAIWPLVKPEQVCGEFMEREEPPMPMAAG